MMDRSVLAAVLVIGAHWSPPMVAQRGGAPAARPRVKVEIVQTVGCVERRTGPEPTWWLTRAAVPVVAREGVFNALQVEEARKAAAPGAREFQLVGVPEFLSPDQLLRSGDRASFTTPDQVNATGELREGRTVLVKGLLIESGGAWRINLLAVVGIADACS